MAWKPKEKQLTIEEAVEVARKELAPYWVNSEPLVGGIKLSSESPVTVHALDKLFESRPTVICLVDLTTFSGESVTLFAREWAKRYAPQNLGFLLVVKPTYSFLSEIKALQLLLTRSPVMFPMTLDHDGVLFQSLVGQLPLPRILLYHQHKVVLDHTGPAWFKDIEVEIQRFLRKMDPGLPLAPALEGSEIPAIDRKRYELGQGLRSPDLKMTGKWTQEADRVLTSDPTATMSFRSPAARVSLVARAAGKASEEVGHLRVDLGGEPVFDAAAGMDLTASDTGGTELKVKEPRVYHTLARLPDTARQVLLRFPDAERVPIAIYAIQCGD
jgi:hypothetical protein